jgi:hypothetical protein
MKDIIPYNQKAFLLPDSIRSAAMYHAKIMADGEYMFRIHDCNDGIRLRGDITDPEQIKEAVTKLRCLARAADDFADFIFDNYIVTST